MLRGVGDIVQLMANLLPPWAVGLIVGTIVLMALPAWVRSGKGKRIRGDIRRMVRADLGRREELHRDILARAGRDKHLLELIVKEARRREHFALSGDALERLRSLPHSEDFVERCEAPPKPEKPEKRWGHPIEAAAAIQTLIDNGAYAAAETRLAEVRERFPADADLAELQQSLGQHRTAESG